MKKEDARRIIQDRADLAALEAQLERKKQVLDDYVKAAVHLEEVCERLEDRIASAQEMTEVYDGVPISVSGWEKWHDGRWHGGVSLPGDGYYRHAEIYQPAGKDGHWNRLNLKIVWWEPWAGTMSSNDRVALWYVSREVALKAAKEWVVHGKTPEKMSRSFSRKPDNQVSYA